MKFIIEDEVFEKLQDVCFGAIVAEGIENKYVDGVKELLSTEIAKIEEEFEDKKVKEDSRVETYREAFRSLDINPNKFMSSIEALLTRVSKKKGLPNINAVVDLGNAISISNFIPLGAHDIDVAGEDIVVRLSKDGDKFIPFGETEAEILDAGEIVYSVGEKIKTRRWIWRQSEEGKVTTESKNIFFPLDGFKANRDRLIKARDELAKELEEKFSCKIKLGFLDKENKEFIIK